MPGTNTAKKTNRKVQNETLPSYVGEEKTGVCSMLLVKKKTFFRTESFSEKFC